jgi:hypothetical protein
MGSRRDPVYNFVYFVIVVVTAGLMHGSTRK